VSEGSKSTTALGYETNFRGNFVANMEVFWPSIVAWRRNKGRMKKNSSAL